MTRIDLPPIGCRPLFIFARENVLSLCHIEPVLCRVQTRMREISGNYFSALDVKSMIVYVLDDNDIVAKIFGDCMVRMVNKIGDMRRVFHNRSCRSARNRPIRNRVTKLNYCVELHILQIC